MYEVYGSRQNPPYSVSPPEYSYFILSRNIPEDFLYAYNFSETNGSIIRIIIEYGQTNRTI